MSEKSPTTISDSRGQKRKNRDGFRDIEHGLDNQHIAPPQASSSSPPTKKIKTKITTIRLAVSAEEEQAMRQKVDNGEIKLEVCSTNQNPTFISRQIVDNDKKHLREALKKARKKMAEKDGEILRLRGEVETWQGITEGAEEQAEELERNRLEEIAGEKEKWEEEAVGNEPVSDHDNGDDEDDEEYDQERDGYVPVIEY